MMKQLTMVAITSALLAACDSAQPKIQYVPDMADAPTMKPQENYL